MKKYFLINSDVYFIAERIKQIDKNYFIVFNRLKNKFEVHAFGQAGGTYCFTIPFDALDERTLEFTLKTRSQNMAQIIKEIDEANQKLQKDNLKFATKKIEEVLL